MHERIQKSKKHLNVYIVIKHLHKRLLWRNVKEFKQMKNLKYVLLQELIQIKNLMHILFVINHLLKVVSWIAMKVPTQEKKSLIIFILWQDIFHKWWSMKGLTLVKNIIDVLFVLKCLHKIKIWRNMKEHIQVKKTYACWYCDKKFEGNQNIKMHERIHTSKNHLNVYIVTKHLHERIIWRNMKELIQVKILFENLLKVVIEEPWKYPHRKKP